MLLRKVFVTYRWMYYRVVLRYLCSVVVLAPEVGSWPFVWEMKTQVIHFMNFSFLAYVIYITSSWWYDYLGYFILSNLLDDLTKYWINPLLVIYKTKCMSHIVYIWCTHLGGDHFNICVLETNNSFSELVVSIIREYCSQSGVVNSSCDSWR